MAPPPVVWVRAYFCSGSGTASTSAGRSDMKGHGGVMSESFEGGCTCRGVRYRVTRRPMVVHACHCSWCQRETGTAFATNAVIETTCVVVDGPVEVVDTPSASGHGQRIARCPKC